MHGFAQKVRESRLARNLSVRELARRADVSPSLISRIERGQANPTAGSILAIANALRQPLDYFFNGSDNSNGNDSVAKGGYTAGTSESPIVYDAEGIPVPVGSSAPRVSKASPVVRAKERCVLKIAGGIEWSRLTPPHDDLLEFMEIRYELGAASSEMPICHGGREYGWVLQGRVLVELGFTKYVLEAGDSISYDCAVPHRLVNVGDEPLVAAWIVVDRY